MFISFYFSLELVTDEADEDEEGADEDAASSDEDEHPSILDDSDPDCEDEKDVESDVFNNSIQTIAQTSETLIAKDGTVWSKIPLVQKSRQRQCNVFKSVKNKQKK